MAGSVITYVLLNNSMCVKRKIITSPSNNKRFKKKNIEIHCLEKFNDTTLYRETVRENRIIVYIFFLKWTRMRRQKKISRGFFSSVKMLTEISRANFFSQLVCAIIIIITIFSLRWEKCFKKLPFLVNRCAINYTRIIFVIIVVLYSFKRNWKFFLHYHNNKSCHDFSSVSTP